VKILQVTEHCANCRPVLLCSDGMSVFMIQQWVKKSGGRTMLKTFEMCETDFAKLETIHSEKRARKTRSSTDECASKSKSGVIVASLDTHQRWARALSKALFALHPGEHGRVVRKRASSSG
jgi:hypothetical protein